MHIFTTFKNTIFLLILLSYNIALADINNDLIQKIQQNLKSLDKVAIDFLQIDKNNNSSEGKLLIQKPHSFRCNYYPPYPLLIVGGKKYISMYDYSMETISRISPKENIMNALFMGNFDNSIFKVTQTKELPENIVITLLNKENDQQIEAFFEPKTFRLAKIIIFELNSPSIMVTFDKPAFVKNFNKQLFEMRDPTIFGAPKQLDQKQIEAQYDLN